jgi:hypothetical protein
VLAALRIHIGMISHGGYDTAKLMLAVVAFLECVKQALGAGDGECSSGSVDKTVVD